MTLLSIILIQNSIFAKDQCILSSIDVPKEGKEKIVNYLLNPELKTLSSDPIAASALIQEKLSKPTEVEISQFLLGLNTPIKNPLKKIKLKFSFPNFKISKINFGDAITECNDTICKVKISLLQFKSVFDFLIQGDGVHFEGKQVKLSLNKSPSIELKISILSKGEMNHALKVIEKPKIIFPAGTIALSAGLNDLDQKYLHRKAAIKISEKIFNQQALSDDEKLIFFNSLDKNQIQDEKLVELYLAETGKILVDEIRKFSNTQSFYFFSVFKMLSEQLLIDNVWNDMVLRYIEENELSTLLNLINESLEENSSLKGTQVNLPIFNLQDEVDFESNQKVTKEMIKKAQRGKLQEKEISPYLRRYKNNSDIRSVEILEQLIREIDGDLLFDEAINEIETTQTQIYNSALQSQKLVDINFEVERIGSLENMIRLNLKTPSYCTPSETPNFPADLNFKNRCDFVSHISVDAMNIYLKEMHRLKYFDSCITISDNVCDYRDPKFVGHKFEFTNPLEIRWDEDKQQHYLYIDRLNIDSSLSFLQLTKLLGITKDSITGSVYLDIVTCGDGALCIKPDASSLYLTLSNSNMASKIMGVFKIFQLPYFLVGNLLLGIGFEQIKGDIEKNRIGFPDFRFVETINSKERISICAQIKD